MSQMFENLALATFTRNFAMGRDAIKIPGREERTCS